MLPGAAASPVPTGRDDGAGQPPQAASLQQGVASAAGQEALLARCKLIFLGDSVRASGLGAVASPSTLRAILAAELAANALWKTHVAVFGHSYIRGLPAVIIPKALITGLQTWTFSDSGIASFASLTPV